MDTISCDSPHLLSSLNELLSAFGLPPLVASGAGGLDDEEFLLELEQMRIKREQNGSDGGWGDSASGQSIQSSVVSSEEPSDEEGNA